MPSARTKTLFHFTSSLEFIKSILKEGFWPRYCLEDLAWLSGKPYYAGYPTVCFCDIPISRLEEHAEEYGPYGIGMSQEWAKEKGLNPIQYVNENSAQAQAFKDLIRMSSNKDEQFLRTFLALSGFAKPLIGDGGSHGIKDFYEECEWRYMPKWEVVNEVGFPDKDAFEEKAEIEDLNLKIKAKSMLPFAPKDVRYILVEQESEIIPLYDFIQNELSGEERDLKVLTTRIHCFEELAQDV